MEFFRDLIQVHAALLYTTSPKSEIALKAPTGLVGRGFYRAP
jgi:hypothetical protein